MKAKRPRFYKLYGSTVDGPFTNKSSAYSCGTHRWTYYIRATSIKQAYALCYKQVWQDRPEGVGVASYELDWWHYGSLIEALKCGNIVIAPCYGNNLTAALPTPLCLEDSEKDFLAEMAAAGKLTWHATR